MEFALGVLHWAPEHFWKSTMCELMAANAGYLSVTKPKDTSEPMLRDEFEELKKRLG